jgi:hypothetical protein
MGGGPKYTPSLASSAPAILKFTLTLRPVEFLTFNKGITEDTVVDIDAKFGE